MSFLDARNQYRRTEGGVIPDLTNPYKMVMITLRELQKSLVVLVAAQQKGTKYPSAHVTKSLTAVYVLQSSLDFEKGGEIADNLFRVYEFTRLQLLAAFRREESPRLEAALSYIEDLASAWENMPRGAMQE